MNDKPTPTPPPVDPRKLIGDRIQATIESALGISHDEALAMSKKRKKLLLASLLLQEDWGGLVFWVCRRGEPEALNSLKRRPAVRLKGFRAHLEPDGVRFEDLLPDAQAEGG